MCGDHGAIERRASLPVTTAIDPVAGGHLRRRGDWCDTGEPRERHLGSDPLGALARNDEHLCVGVRADGEGPREIWGDLAGQLGHDLSCSTISALSCCQRRAIHRSVCLVEAVIVAIAPGRTPAHLLVRASFDSGCIS